ncbi:poly(A) RNA polymerase GLD2-like [Biomphalaria glabrata]|uniref:Poly(A) RNA polymerase GLD2-like n=1 Tax=Biomphalaria glabrata TaxID=6526 RepID=A0A9U8DVS8_BIOGL|nr:poly(A) RNA polymerase GLD2-like [Biomphalaria glabrata]
MYQRNMGAGFNFHNLIGFAPSIRFHQQPFVIQQPFSDSMRPHRNLMGSSAPLDFIPVQRPSVPQITSVNFNHVSNIHTSPPQQTVKKKRPNDDLSLPPNKRAKFNSHNSQRTLQLDRPTSSVREEDFLVPVNHGTEEITIGIWDYFLTAHMKDEDLKRKLKLRKCLLSVMSGAFPNCRLFLVGSSMTGFATRSSDVDMCLMITDQEIDQKYEATVILNSISRVFRKCSFMRSPQVIKAKVPIFKFFDAISQVECDLNINNIVGIRNTHLLRYYAYMDWRVRPLMLFIKFWARFHDINDASKKTISSYSLTLMLIHYLQAGVSPPVLPCLHSLKPHLFSTFNKVYRLTLDFDENNINFISRNNVTLGELFLGFLNYYANRFDYNTQVISVRLGKAIHRREVNDSNNSGQWKFLNIEEPFDKSNTARSVFDYHVFQRILRVFKVSYNTLEKSRNVKDILSRPF